MPVYKPFSASKNIYEIFRQNDVTQAHCRKQNLRKRSYIDYRSILIQTSKSWNWTTFIAIFAVVIVFNNVGSSTRCPLQKIEAPRQGKGYTSGILMRRRDV